MTTTAAPADHTTNNTADTSLADSAETEPGEAVQVDKPPPHLSFDPTDSWWQRLQPQLLPWKLGGIIAAAANVAWVASLFLHPLLMAALVAIAGGVWLAYWRHTTSQHGWLTTRAAHYAYFVYVLGVGWSAWYLLAGPSARLWCAGGLLVLVGGIRHWRNVRIPNPADFAPPEPDTPPAVEDPVAEEATPVEEDTPVSIHQQVVDDWDTHIAAANAPLPGSSVDITDIGEYSTVYDGMLVRAKQTFKTVTDNLDKIATGLDIPAHQLIVEEHPSGRPSLFQLTYNHTDAIGESAAWPGSTFDTESGQIRLGPHTDGQGEATWRIFSKNSIWSGFICGQTGTGKSRDADVIAYNLIDDGRTVVWAGDATDGASSPALTRHADWYAGAERVLGMLQAAERIIQYRKALLKVRGQVGFTPSRKFPALMIILDEVHELVKDKAVAEVLKTIATLGRKFGVALILMAQQASLESFGNNEALRANIVAGNLVMHKTSTKNQSQLIGGVDINPNNLPGVPGYAYRNAPTDKNGRRVGRSAPFRVYHMGDRPEEASDDEVDPSVALFDSIPCEKKAQLDAGSARFAGEAYLHRRGDAEADMDRNRAIVEAAESGDHDEINRVLAGDIKAAGSQTADQYGAAIEFPTWADFADVGQDETRGVDSNDDHQLSEAARTVLATVRNMGRCRPVDIVRRTDLSDRHVRNQLQYLIDLDLISKDPEVQGIYYPT
ncbi:hypothetical protein [Haloglycomyces albus]|uniref:hypothetical protein n=1 Tax=Haloglycomyces albus TaxID=526067 RepID=UPI00046D64E7|nr:hypothetical protein [Haloglycomyces albus]